VGDRQADRALAAALNPPGDAVFWRFGEGALWRVDIGRLVIAAKLVSDAASALAA